MIDVYCNPKIRLKDGSISTNALLGNKQGESVGQRQTERMISYRDGVEDEMNSRPRGAYG